MRLSLFVALSLAVAAGCVRLGVWQLERRDQRRTHNAAVEARIHQPPVPVDTLLHGEAGPGALQYRAAEVEGTPDFDQELVLATRTHNGAPGVHLLTPVRVAGSDRVILVNRGWVYSPDGVQVDLARWRDTARVFRGYVEEFVAAEGIAILASRPRTLRRMDRDSIEALLPYPVAPAYVVLTGSGPPSPDRPALLATPALGDGPHFNYAMQWFGFALVAVVGAGIVGFRDRRGGSRGVRGA